MIWPALGVVAALTIVPAGVEHSPESPPAGTHSPGPATPSVGKRETVADPGLPPVLRCIAWHESRGITTAVSPDGEYRGKFQLSMSFSPAWANRYGFPQWASLPADRWPAAVQDAVAVALFRDFPQAWAGDLAVCG